MLVLKRFSLFDGNSQNYHQKYFLNILLYQITQKKHFLEYVKYIDNYIKLIFILLICDIKHYFNSWKKCFHKHHFLITHLALKRVPTPKVLTSLDLYQSIIEIIWCNSMLLCIYLLLFFLIYLKDLLRKTSNPCRSQ